MKKFIIPIIFLIIVIIFFSVPIGSNPAKRFIEDLSFSIQQSHLASKCKAEGGSWQTSPMSYGGNCYHPTGDEGKQCYQKSDCVRDCIYNNDSPEKDKQGYLLGKCGIDDLSECRTHLIPIKTRNTSDLIGNGCA